MKTKTWRKDCFVKKILMNFPGEIKRYTHTKGRTEIMISLEFI